MSQPTEDAAKLTTARWMWLKGIFPIVGTLVLTFAAIYCCWLVIQPFFPVLAWTCAFVVSAMPLHKRIEKFVPSRTLAASITVGVVLVLLLLPAALLVPPLIDQAILGLHAVQAQLGPGGLQDLIERHAWIKSGWQWLTERVDLNAVFQHAAALLTTGASYLVKGSFAGLIELALVIFFLFFFLRDHAEVMQSVRAYLPLTPREADKFFAAITGTVYATVFGKFLMGVLQGILIGLMFWWLGLTAPTLWAMVIVLLSFVPVVGASVVWLPAAVLLFLGGHWIKAVILISWGGVLVGTIDNILYPMLLRRHINLHPLPIFIAMVGGLIAFGPPGFFLGPVVLTVTLVLLRICHERALPASEIERANK